MPAANISTLNVPPSYALQLIEEVRNQLTEVNAIAFAGFKLIDANDENGDLTSRALFGAIEQLSESRSALNALHELISRQVGTA